MNLCLGVVVISPLLCPVSSSVYVTPDAAFLSSSLDITALRTGVDQVTELALAFLPRSMKTDYN